MKVEDQEEAKQGVSYMGSIVLEGKANDPNLRNEARVRTVLCKTNLEGTVQGRVRFKGLWHLGMCMFNNIMGCVPMCYTLVYKLTQVYTNDTCHFYAQEYIYLYGLLSLKEKRKNRHSSTRRLAFNYSCTHYKELST